MSVYLALHTSPSPNVGDIAEFGRLALQLGARPDQPLAVQRDRETGALTVVLPISPTGCPCGCSAGVHVGEIGCPCGLPDESPCRKQEVSA